MQLKITNTLYKTLSGLIILGLETVCWRWLWPVVPAKNF